jgi:predicted metal-binding membrane protein
VMGSAELSRAVPMAEGVVVVIAGALQFSAWKARHLACCRGSLGCGGRSGPNCALGRDGASGHNGASGRRGALALGGTPFAVAGSAWRHGMRLGVHCIYCCAGLTAILLVIGVMDLRAMAVVTAAITLERLAPAGERVARIIGAVIVGAGLVLIARAM